MSLGIESRIYKKKITFSSATFDSALLFLFFNSHCIPQTVMHLFLWLFLTDPGMLLNYLHINDDFHTNAKPKDSKTNPSQGMKCVRILSLMVGLLQVWNGEYLCREPSEYPCCSVFSLIRFFTYWPKPKNEASANFLLYSFSFSLSGNSCRKLRRLEWCPWWVIHYLPS